MDRTTATLALVFGAAIGYLLRSWKPSRRVVHWAQHWQPGTPSWWLAQPVLAAAIAGLWIRHPKRSAANTRSWDMDQTVPPPQYDPEWAAERSAR